MERGHGLTAHFVRDSAPNSPECLSPGGAGEFGGGSSHLRTSLRTYPCSEGNLQGKALSQGPGRTDYRIDVEKESPPLRPVLTRMHRCGDVRILAAAAHLGHLRGLLRKSKRIGVRLIREVVPGLRQCNHEMLSRQNSRL